MALKTIYMLITPKFISSTWLSPQWSCLIYPNYLLDNSMWRFLKHLKLNIYTKLNSCFFPWKPISVQIFSISISGTPFWTIAEIEKKRFIFLILPLPQCTHRPTEQSCLAYWMLSLLNTCMVACIGVIIHCLPPSVFLPPVRWQSRPHYWIIN